MTDSMVVCPELIQKHNFLQLERLHSTKEKKYYFKLVHFHNFRRVNLSSEHNHRKGLRRRNVLFVLFSQSSCRNTHCLQAVSLLCKTDSSMVSSYGCFFLTHSFSLLSQNLAFGSFHSLLPYTKTHQCLFFLSTSLITFGLLSELYGLASNLLSLFFIQTINQHNFPYHFLLPRLRCI